jgi:hypothetical protein
VEVTIVLLPPKLGGISKPTIQVNKVFFFFFFHSRNVAFLMMFVYVSSHIIILIHEILRMWWIETSVAKKKKKVGFKYRTGKGIHPQAPRIINFESFEVSLRQFRI